MANDAIIATLETFGASRLLSQDLGRAPLEWRDQRVVLATAIEVRGELVSDEKVTES